MDSPVEIKDLEEIKSLLQTGRSLIMFYATWCGHCQEMKPIYQDLKEQYPEVYYYRVDVDQSPEIVQQYKIKMVPTFYFFEDGIFGGEIPDIEDSEELNQYLGSPSI